MKVHAVLNKDSGTLKTTDLDALAERLHEDFAAEGHDLAIDVIPGRKLMSSLETACARDEVDIVIAAGGDGTISAAAGTVWKCKKTLGVLPAGTFNLFARSLGLPLDPFAASPVLATGVVATCDIATANGRPFIHQFSVGLQPSVIKRREKAKHGSRFGKMIAGARAMLETFERPPAFVASVTSDGLELDDFPRYGLIAVSNNPFGANLLPFADRPDGGRLGLYRAPPLGTAEALQVAAGIFLDSWENSPHLEASSCSEVTLNFPRLKRSSHASIDGELVRLEPSVTIRIQPGSLSVLVPRTT